MDSPDAELLLHYQKQPLSQWGGFENRVINIGCYSIVESIDAKTATQNEGADDARAHAYYSATPRNNMF